MGNCYSRCVRCCSTCCCACCCSTCCCVRCCSTCCCVRCCSTCCYVRCCCVDEEQEQEQSRNRDRKEQESAEKKAARKEVEKFCNRPEIKDLYELAPSDHSINIGGRLQKYWFFLNKVPAPEQDSSSAGESLEPIGLKHSHALLSISPVSANFPLSLDTTTVQTLNHILTQVQEHPYLPTVHGIWHLPDDDGGGKGQVIVIQDFHKIGSLRDYIFKKPPYERKRQGSFLISWSEKYDKKGIPIGVDEIAMFGGQILQAIKFLYKSGFQSLGHVHVGNVFVHEDQDGQKVCKLGGYDQTLLGYRPRLYRDILDMKLLQHIDVIMFGHVIFEMGSGTSLSNVTPTQEEYEMVNEQVRGVLHFIFDEHRDFKKIRKHSFFRDAYASWKVKIQCKLSSEEKTVLSSVHAPYAV